MISCDVFVFVFNSRTKNLKNILKFGVDVYISMNTQYYSIYIYSMTTQNKFLNVLYINIQIMYTTYWEYTKVESNIFLFVLVSLFFCGQIFDYFF